MELNREEPGASGRSMNAGRLMFYFGLMYFCEGVCQITALVDQPIRAYLKSIGYDAEATSRFFFVARIPWIIKPVYGLVSDFIPLLGYRRRSYLMLLNLAAGIGFLWMAGMNDVKVLLIASVVVGVGVAAADVIVDALMVEAGQETGMTAKFQSVQWICIQAASVLSGVVSALVLKFCGAPLTAVKVSAAICIFVPVVVAACTVWAVHEEKSKLNLVQLKATASGVAAAFKSPQLIAVVVFLALLAANPGVVTPMNFHLTKVLKISDSFVALGHSFYAGGSMAGAIFYLLVIGGRVSTRKSLVIGILANAASMLPYLVVRGPVTCGIAAFIFGIGYQVGHLAMLTLAAEVCPKRAEGFVFAAIMSVLNYSMQQSDVWGSKLYSGYFAGNVIPLIWISIGLSLVALPFVPVLPLGKSERRAEELEAVVG